MSLKKAKKNNPLFGKTHSKDTIELMRQKALGRIHSEDTKLKMSAIRGNPVNIYEKCSSEGFKLIGSFVSARRAGKFLGISGSTVIKYMNSVKYLKNRYKFSSKVNLEKLWIKFHYMLEIPKSLRYYRIINIMNLKYEITMDNQQETKRYLFVS